MNAVNIVMLLCVAVIVGNELVTVNDCVVFVHGHIVRPLNEVIINSVLLSMICTGENPEDGTGCVRRYEEAQNEGWRLACTRRTPAKDGEEANCIMIVYMNCQLVNNTKM
jgi:hypothetical protein